MRDDTSKPLDPEIAAWLRRAEPYPDASHEVRARVGTALRARIAMSSGDPSQDGDGSPGADGSLGGDGSTGAMNDAPFAAVASPRLASLGVRLFSTTARAVSSLVVTFALGGAVGAVLLASWRPPRERVVYVDGPSSAVPSSSAVPRAATKTAPTSLPEPTAPAVAATPAVSAAPVNDVPSSPNRVGTPNKSAPSGEGSTGSVATSISDLEMEQKLLDVARNALTRGQPREALSPLDRHAQRYPRGVLAEEREALAVNALVTLGRYTEARERAGRFLQRYPSSLLRPSVEAAIAAIP